MLSKTQTGCVLIDLIGTELTAEECELIKHPMCAGLVLFSRNYDHPKQLKALTDQVRQMNPNALLAVDQEGGRVQRFRDGFSTLPPMSYWGHLFEKDPQKCYLKLSQAIHTLSTELQQVGINLNLIPVLDLNYGVSEIIGERSLNRDPNIIIEVGRLIIQELRRYGFPSVGKHFPGHGAVVVDSHQALPLDNRDWNTLWQNDLRPFVALLDQLDMIMPAHIVFSQMDYKPTTFSPFWLKDVLRRRFNYQGLIISDDLSMAAAATRGNYAERALEAYLAGCDLLLVCNNRDGAVSALTALMNKEQNHGH